MRRHCRPPFGWESPVKEVVYPVKENVVHCCSEETIKHIHPSHTTIVNHHLVKNEHYYPHTTSVENTYEEIDVQGSGMGNNDVAGMQEGPGWMGMGPGKKGCKQRRRPHPW